MLSSVAPAAPAAPAATATPAAAPELVCPAGSLPALKAAIDGGADCVYLGLRDATNARNFAGLKAGATDQDVFDVGSAIAGLQKLTVVGITRTSAADLANE